MLRAEAPTMPQFSCCQPTSGESAGQSKLKHKQFVKAVKAKTKPMIIMLTRYSVEFTISFRRHQVSHHYWTDDPVALEEFIVELLEEG